MYVSPEKNHSPFLGGKVSVLTSSVFSCDGSVAVRITVPIGRRIQDVHIGGPETITVLPRHSMTTWMPSEAGFLHAQHSRSISFGSLYIFPSLLCLSFSYKRLSYMESFLVLSVHVYHMVFLSMNKFLLRKRKIVHKLCR